MSALVNVAEFRQKTDSLFQLVNRDYHACVGLSEVKNWHSVATRMLAEVKAVGCRRASEYDKAQHALAVAQATAQLAAASGRISEQEHKRVGIERVQALRKAMQTRCGAGAVNHVRSIPNCFCARCRVSQAQ